MNLVIGPFGVQHWALIIEYWGNNLSSAFRAFFDWVLGLYIWLWGADIFNWAAILVL